MASFADTRDRSVPGEGLDGVVSPYQQFYTETDAEKVMISELISAVEASEEYKMKDPLYVPTRMTYRRFVRGSKMNITKAVEDMTKMLAFRREEKVQSVTEANYTGILAQTEQSIVLNGKDHNGRPLVEVFAAKHDKNNRDINEYKAFVIHTFEQCMSYGNDERLSFVFYMENFGIFKNMDFECVKCLVSILQSYYPETLNTALIIDAPFVFWGCWKVIKPWLDPVTAAKVTFIKKKDLATHLRPATAVTVAVADTKAPV